MIETRSLDVRIGGTPVLDRVDVAIGGGAITAFVGPNGAGKSTLLAALGRLIRPHAGRILIDGQEIGTIPSPALARRLAILRQSAGIAPRLTVGDLVAFGRYPHCGGRLGPDDRAIVADCLADLDIADLAGRFLDTVSGGQRQRALIAMTLAQTPEMLLLDEPLNNLDLSHVRRVMEVARRRAADGAAVAIVLHDLTVAARYADRIVALKNGRVFADGTPAEVVTPATLGTLYGTPIEVHEVAGRRVVLTA
ncbi:putative siderophore transport system ATP-binding protein YusV [Roseivivax jejudonensis]|uniref:Putative siderophore transport system ATP-binding protein YusV n=1 Tax=Roseivivax jejudonensis TaxID=1529041 RepID=A0A1X6YW89_9RHOB|nr:ATP-binding cassette domain-containing protein [Roseivivax jejudonensis]SLN32384.1 putative siderophore transport system ATP-binding protein YusV [Roseivivax jejudonensis]